MSNPERILHDVASYYTAKLTQHGSTPQGVDWNGEAGQQLRFAQLEKLLPAEGPFSLNDIGCGYGALVDFLLPRHPDMAYCGIDISAAMIEAAQQQHALPQARFVVANRPDHAADFSVASGIFNVRLGHDETSWNAYILATLDTLHASSSRGFAFNCLTAYSDADKMRPDLHYADPCALFDHCKRHYSKDVALLHDYGLYEFTLLVRKSA